MAKAPHARALDILVRRSGALSVVLLQSGKICQVYDVAWGYDMGDEVAHITSNISPGPAIACGVDFFLASEIQRIEDGQDGRRLFEASADEASDSHSGEAVRRHVSLSDGGG